MVGLSLQSDALAADPVENVSLGVDLRGTVYPLARRLELERAEARVRDVTARLSGHVAMPAGTFQFTNGKSLSVVPDIDLHFSVPRVACAKLLSSIPTRAGAAAAGVRAAGVLRRRGRARRSTSPTSTISI